METVVHDCNKKQLDKMETESELKEMFSSAIAEWLETAEVDRKKYPVKYHKAIQSQRRIGWRHIFKENCHKNGYNYTMKAPTQRQGGNVTATYGVRQ
jgi:hypothetical protein